MNQPCLDFLTPPLAMASRRTLLRVSITLLESKMPKIVKEARSRKHGTRELLNPTRVLGGDISLIDMDFIIIFCN